MAKLGTPCQMLVQLGNDDPGRRYVDEFKKHGVDTSNVKLLEGEDTGNQMIKCI